MEVVMSSDSVLEQEFCRLVEQYQTALLRMCYIYLHDTALAEDAVQEACWRKGRNGQPKTRGGPSICLTRCM